MEMFKLTPACKDYLWGGDRLIKDFGIDYQGDVCAEAWVLSCHKDGASVVENGKFAGKTLTEVLQGEGKDFLGTNCDRFEDFPILIKFIDAKKALSIQVHPDDEYALKNEGQFGKTEMWYILDAKEGAFLYHGFEKEICKEEFEERIKNNTLTEVLHKEYVKKGDIVFVSPGTLHAIGEGIVIAEIQQNSNVTYRIYDYGRVGADGKPRQLHIQQSIDVTSLTKPEKYESPNEHMVSCNFFDVDHVTVSEGKGFKTVAGETSFVSILVTEGNAVITGGEKELTAKKGESVFVPAGLGKFAVSGDAELLITRIPEGKECRQALSLTA
jgi:mannose-6-phosphate isomerase